MATTPEVDEPQETRVQRVRTAVAAPLEQKNRPVTLLAISAAVASLAPDPFGALAAALMVIVAADTRRR